MARQVKIDFDEWCQLAQKDPKTFEKRRLALIENAILTAPFERQQRLRGLQWRIDHERRLAPNPLAGCVKISRMMWETVQGENGLLAAIEDLNACLAGDRRKPLHPGPGARVIPFRHPDR